MISDFDLTLYLVTDSQMVPKTKTLAQMVKEAIEGGVTIVQLREKTTETNDFITLAKSIQQVTKKHNVPLLINDRIDVALAIDADGVHIGQDDMPLDMARRLLGNKKIIGVSVKSSGEAIDAIKGGADYLGIGTCFDTATKQVSEGDLRGPVGIREIWQAALDTGGDKPVRAVTIGGVNTYNAVHVLHCTRAQTPESRALDGIAVVSAIMAASDPRDAAKTLRKQINFALCESWLAKQQRLLRNESSRHAEATVRQAVVDVFTQVRISSSQRALIQHITNSVVTNDSANTCLALGGSPIMATSDIEQKDLAPAISALLINIGTIDQEHLKGMRAAMREAQLYNTPIVLDPVAIGASEFRKTLVHGFLRDFGVHVIKGNAGEIASLLDTKEVQMRGVDSLGSGFADPVAAVKALSLRYRCIVVMTGVVDYVSDGITTFSVHNGHFMQGCITGSGCMVGTSVATFVQAVAHQDPLVGALAGVVAINLAAEHAARRPDVKGPGTFRQAFFDEMYNIAPDDIHSEMQIRRLS
ncbi:thiamine biosynthetic bifunctional enzyme [Coemansia erecta]|uniref:Thiamine biosynthetic bifunctional enzyme n=1 Tax=Coemansia asiatica TaxID=1052880 RepID=A0A9W7XGS5_9FUNG|nr:thiamine biosynthetic bifunctional enzyme [Coemansia asiatica]KAJ2856711.1 thiamine biosynthetic bifunctional enzyme [Coemansia erecta]KAJ2882963.1 thiamine biosynthetic bifunctional enzyme [Coemansia asiatica]